MLAFSERSMQQQRTTGLSTRSSHRRRATCTTHGDVGDERVELGSRQRVAHRRSWGLPHATHRRTIREIIKRITTLCERRRDMSDLAGVALRAERPHPDDLHTLAGSCTPQPTVAVASPGARLGRPRSSAHWLCTAAPPDGHQMQQQTHTDTHITLRSHDMIKTAPPCGVPKWPCSTRVGTNMSQ
jgi:hypothetical protein